MSDYDAFAKEYAEHASSSVYNAGYERPAMRAALGDVRGARVLDAGCAAGSHSEHLIAQGARVVAIDKSAALIEMVRARLGDRVEAHCADLEQSLTFFSNESFDLVFSSLTLHYLRWWSGVFAEFKRILRPGGRLLFSTHHPAMTAPLVSDYFETQPVADRWKLGDREVDLTFYHRPLHAILGSLLQSGFRLRSLIEPRLATRPANASDTDFERLSKHPWFLIVDAVAE
ncbi:MAG: class I SAM-dependent methyltransferase [Candidatus Eremiobacteraeota bacterium]|nr:class I SAM-dependent methyltransferase [Candidatus Eremiobacteraeota bacterium]